MPGGQISTYPAWGGTMSSLRTACVFQHNTTTDDVSSKFTIHDFKNVAWHNGAARTVTAPAIPSGSTTFTLASCAGITTWTNRVISTADNTAGFAARSFVKSISGGCLVTLNLATTGAITAGKLLKIENSSPRSVADGVTTAASTTITSASANFSSPGDVGFSVSGTNIPLGTTIASVTNATTAVLSNPADATGATQVLNFGGSYQASDTRTVNDVTYTSSTTITSTAAKFKVDDIGLPVYGTGIASPCFITARTNTVATLSTACVTVDALTHIVTVGDPSATAALDGESVMDQGVQLDLNPTLVKGTRPCADNSVEGFHISGTWANPGGSNWFTGAFATQPAGTKAVGEIVVRTSAGVNYGGFIIEQNATGDAVIGVAHYDVVFPFVPTGIAECAATATSPGLGFSLGIAGVTSSVALLPQGTGRPGTGQLRATTDDAQLGGTTTGYIVSDDVLHPWSFNRLCVIPAGAPSVNFQCGTG